MADEVKKLIVELEIVRKGDTGASAGDVGRNGQTNLPTQGSQRHDSVTPSSHIPPPLSANGFTPGRGVVPRDLREYAVQQQWEQDAPRREREAASSLRQKRQIAHWQWGWDDELDRRESRAAKTEAAYIAAAGRKHDRWERRRDRDNYRLNDMFEAENASTMSDIASGGPSTVSAASAAKAAAIFRHPIQSGIRALGARGVTVSGAMAVGAALAAPVAAAEFMDSTSNYLDRTYNPQFAESSSTFRGWAWEKASSLPGGTLAKMKYTDYMSSRRTESLAGQTERETSYQETALSARMPMLQQFQTNDTENAHAASKSESATGYLQAIRGSSSRDLTSPEVGPANVKLLQAQAAQKGAFNREDQTPFYRKNAAEFEAKETSSQAWLIKATAQLDKHQGLHDKGLPNDLAGASKIQLEAAGNARVARVEAGIARDRLLVEEKQRFSNVMEGNAATRDVALAKADVDFGVPGRIARSGAQQWGLMMPDQKQILESASEMFKQGMKPSDMAPIFKDALAGNAYTSGPFNERAAVEAATDPQAQRIWNNVGRKGAPDANALEKSFLEAAAKAGEVFEKANVKAWEEFGKKAGAITTKNTEAALDGYEQAFKEWLSSQLRKLNIINPG